MNHSEYSALQTLMRNGVSVRDKVIYRANNMGIKVWGAVDFLVHYCGYTLAGKR